MRKAKIENVLSRLSIVLGVKTDTELAKALGTTSSTISSWKTRESIPYAKCVELAEAKDISLDWLLTGVGQIYRDQPATETAITSGTGLPPRQQALLDLFNALPEERQREAFSALEDKKRLLTLEEGYKELKAVVEQLKSTG